MNENEIKNLVVRESDLDDVIIVHRNIKEFDVQSPPKSFFEDRYKNLEHVIIVSYYDDIPIGYIIGYEIDRANFYCWIAGVDYNYRGRGALSIMMDYLKCWARKRGYEKISIKTRNRYRGMLSYLVKNNWNFISIEEKEDISNYRINLEISLI